MRKLILNHFLNVINNFLLNAFGIGLWLWWHTLFRDRTFSDFKSSGSVSGSLKEARTHLQIVSFFILKNCFTFSKIRRMFMFRFRLYMYILKRGYSRYHVIVTQNLLSRLAILQQFLEFKKSKGFSLKSNK